MKPIHTASPLLALLLLASGIAAQSTKYTALPPANLTVEAKATNFGLAGSYFGHAAFRAHLASNLLRGKKYMISGLAMRQDGEFFVPFGPGRSWSKLEIQLGETAMASISPTFSSNYKTVPSKVFSGKVSLAARTAPNKKPMPFGTPGLKFPLTKKFAYSGSKDLLIDTTASGGALSAGSWTTLRTYMLDGVTQMTQNGGVSQFAGNSCFATGQTKKFRSGFTQFAFAKYTGNPATNDKMGIAFHARYGPAKASIIQAVSAIGTQKTSPQPGKALPANIGACNPLMVDLGSALYSYGTTDTSGKWDSPNKAPLVLVPYPAWKHLVGIDVYTQIATTDKGKLLLSQTTKTPIVAQPNNVNMLMIYRTGATGTSGVPTPAGMPIVRIAYQ